MDFNLLGRSEQTFGFVNLFCFSGVFGWLVFGVCLFKTEFLYVSLAVLELLALVPQRSAASASPCRDQRHACPTTAQLRGFGFYLLSLGLIPYCTS